MMIFKISRLFYPVLSLFLFTMSLNVYAQDYRLVTAYMTPWSMPGNGDHPGLFIELIQEADRRLGNNTKIEVYPWNRSQEIAQTEKNVIIFPMTRLPSREKTYSWIENIQKTRLSFVSVDRHIKDAAEARTLKRILVHTNAPPELILKKEGFTNLIRQQEVSPQVFRMLKSKRADAWFTAEIMADWLWKLNPWVDTLLFSEPLAVFDLYVAASPDLPLAIKDRFQTVLKEMHADGFIDRVIKRYRP